MGRELMRTPAPEVGAHGVGVGEAEATRDSASGSALVAFGGTAAALRDPRVRGAIGNRAVGRMLARQPAPPPTKKKPEPKSSTEFHIPGNQYEVAFKLKWGRASASFKLVGAWQAAKVAKTPGPGGTSISLLEDKRTWEREGGKWGTKVIEAAAKMDKDVGHLGPITFKLNVKALEAAVGKKDGLPNLDLNLLTASFTAEGDLADELRKDYDIVKDAAPGLKAGFIGEGKVALKAGDLLKLTEFMKAKQKEVEAAENLLKDAKRADAVEKELGTIEKQMAKAPREAEVKALENRYKTFQGYGKRQAKKYGSEAAYKEAKAEAKAAWKRAEAGSAESLVKRKAALEAEKKLLTVSLRKEARIITKARAAAARIAAKMEGAIAKVVVRVVGEKVAAAVGRFLLKAIPIINVLSTLWDIGSLAYSLWKLAHGAKIGSGPDGDSDDGKSQTAGSGSGAGTAGTAGGGQAGGQPDAQPPPPGASPDAPSGPGPQARTDAGPTDATGSGGLGGPVATDDADDDLGPPPQLSKTAKEIADAVGSGSGPMKFDREELDALATVIPGDLDDAQKAELLKHLDEIKKSGQQDPYEVIAGIKEEIERIKRGGPEPIEVSVNGKLRPDLSTGVPDVPPTPQPQPQPQTQPAPQSAPGTTGGKPKGAAKPAPPAKPPTTLLPANLPEVWDLDATGKKWDYLPGGKAKLESLYTLSDGLQVVINSSEVSSEEQSGVLVGRLRLELIVFELPRGAGKDYPWKLGQVENQTITLAYSPTTQTTRRLEAFTTSPWIDFVAVTEKSVVPKASAGLLKRGTVTVRFSGLKNHSIRDINGTPYHVVTLLLTPTEVTDPDSVMIDVEGHVHRFVVGKAIEYRDAFPVPGAKASRLATSSAPSP